MSNLHLNLYQYLPEIVTARSMFQEERSSLDTALTSAT